MAKRKGGNILIEDAELDALLIKFEYEITQKINNILNRHLYHWLNRELPKYSKSKLRKYVYELLNQLTK